MKKVYVVSIDEVSDYVNYPHAPKAFSTKEDALNFLKGAYDQADKELDSDLIREFKTEHGEIYKDGYYCSEHWAITLDEVTVDEVTDEPETGCINFYQQMRDVEDRCRDKVFEMLKSVGGEHEFAVDDDNFNLSLPFYDDYGDASNCVIEKIALVGDDYLEVYTDDGHCCNLRDFADCSIIFIYEQLYKELNPIQIED